MPERIIPQEAWIHFFEVLCIFWGWTAALAWMNGKKILWDFDAYPDEKAGSGSSH